MDLYREGRGFDSLIAHKDSHNKAVFFCYGVFHVYIVFEVVG